MPQVGRSDLKQFFAHIRTFEYNHVPSSYSLNRHFFRTLRGMSKINIITFNFQAWIIFCGFKTIKFTLKFHKIGNLFIYSEQFSFEVFNHQWIVHLVWTIDIISTTYSIIDFPLSQEDKKPILTLKWSCNGV